MPYGLPPSATALLPLQDEKLKRDKEAIYRFVSLTSALLKIQSSFIYSFLNVLARCLLSLGVLR